MPNPRAQRPLSLQAVTEDVRSLAQPAEAMLDMLAGAAKGSVSATLGLPGDIESLSRGIASAFRAPSGQRMDAFAQGMEQPTVMPTTEKISAKLPAVVPTTAPLSRQHSAEYGQGFGEFIPTPGSGRVAMGALNAVKSVPKALQHGALEFAKASAMSAPHVVKPKGGNWLDTALKQEMNRLKPSGPTHRDEALILGGDWERLADTPEMQRQMAINEALGNWTDRNLTNYVKKEMATPEDPVRKLAEQGITHFPVAEDPGYWARHGQKARDELGGQSMAESPLAKQWENRTDAMIDRDTAQQHQDMMHLAPGLYSEKDEWIKKLPPDTSLYRAHGRNFSGLDLGFDHILDVLREDLATGRIRPEQLSKVSMEQAVRRTYEYDQEMAKKMREAKIKATEGMPVYKEYPEGYKWIELKAKEPEALPEGVKRVQQSATQGGLDVPGYGFIEAKWNPKTGLDWEKAERDAKKALSHKPTEEALKYEGETMGHCVGGYCPDVMEGRSRIFSLRDAKGEPHVTVEVGPAENPYLNRNSGNITDKGIQLIRSKFPESNFDTEYGDWFKNSNQHSMHFAKEYAPWIERNYPEIYAATIGEPRGELIRQIKGKQNAAPKKEYLPFVQDFVRGGKWSDVGDIQNTGLHKFGSEYLTPQEAETKFKPMVSDALNYLETHPSLERHRAARQARNDFKGDLRSPEYRQLEKQAGESIAPDVPYTYAELKALLSSPEDWTERGDTIYTPISTALEQIERAKQHLGLLPSTDGMKRGGKVHISDNPDAMQLELEEQRMQDGGTPKKKAIEDFWAGLRESIPASNELGPIDTLKQNLSAMYEGAQKIPGNLYKLATDPSGYIKSLPSPTGDQIINAFGPSDMGFVGSYKPHTPLKPDPTVGTRYKVTDQGGLAPRKDLNIEDLKGSQVKIFPWDATSRNKLVTEVSDVPLTKPVLTEGGDDYMRDLQHIKQNIAGASNRGIANRIMDRISEAAMENRMLGDGTGRVFGFPVRMGEKAERAATFPTDIALDLLKQSGLSKKEMSALDESMRNMLFEGKKGVFKDMAKFGTPEFEYQLRHGLKADKEKGVKGFSDMNMRKAFMDRLAMVENQKRIGYNIQDLTNAVLADELKGIPKGYVGNVAAELDPFGKLTPSKSSTYDTDFPGVYAGSMPNMPVEFLMPNTFENIYREMRKEYPDATQDALRYMTIGAMEKRKQNISEKIGQRNIDAVKTYQEGLMKGEFDPNNTVEVYEYMRRKKMGLKNIKKAEGGEITADDLIIEERKL